MSYKRVFRFAFYSTFGLIVMLVLLHPYSRQVIFGPRIDGLPLAYWQDQFRGSCDPTGAVPPSLTSKIIRWLGLDRGDQPWNLPTEKADRLELLLSLEGDPQQYVRVAVADRLGLHSPTERTVQCLRRMLGDRDATVRATAANTLTAVEPLPVDALPKLRAMMADDDPKCRLTAAAGVWKLGQKQDREVIALARKALTDPDPEIRLLAVRVLVFWIGKDAAEAFPDIADRAANEPGTRARSMAIEGLYILGGDAAIPHLIRALNDSDFRCHAIAVSDLELFGPKAKEAVPALEALLRRDVSMSDNIARALSKIDPKRFPAPQKKDN